jgi:hypothetical protein
MGIKRRIVDLLASVFATAPDHPARGGLIGAGSPDDGADDRDGDGEPDAEDGGDGDRNVPGRQ